MHTTVNFLRAHSHLLMSTHTHTGAESKIARTCALVYTQSHTHTHTLSLSLSLSLTHTHTHTHRHTHSTTSAPARQIQSIVKRVRVCCLYRSQEIETTEQRTSKEGPTKQSNEGQQKGNKMNAPFLGQQVMHCHAVAAGLTTPVSDQPTDRPILYFGFFKSLPEKDAMLKPRPSCEARRAQHNHTFVRVSCHCKVGRATLRDQLK